MRRQGARRVVRAASTANTVQSFHGGSRGAVCRQPLAARHGHVANHTRPGARYLEIIHPTAVAGTLIVPVYPAALTLTIPQSAHLPDPGYATPVTAPRQRGPPVDQPPH